MIEIDHTRYTKMSRQHALAFLERAELAPDKFIAHKDKTFTAKFRRRRKKMFQTHSYEERMEKIGDHRLAILKRPNVKLDRGPYITLRFAFASLESLGLDKSQFIPKQANGSAKAIPNGKSNELIDPFAIVELSKMAHDIKNLAHEAHKLAKDPTKHHHHLLVLLEELEKHATELVKAIK
jgi:hypothetical protein